MEGDKAVEHVEIEVVEESMLGHDLIKPSAPEPDTFDGDVSLSGPGDTIYLIPTPSPDPRE